MFKFASSVRLSAHVKHKTLLSFLTVQRTPLNFPTLQRTPLSSLTLQRLAFSSISSDRILQELEHRGVIFQQTEGLAECLARKPGIYAGFDPTADGLHVGNLLVLTTLRRFHAAGVPVTVLVGGATGLIGDPSGRSVERPLLDAQNVRHNVSCIKREIRQFMGADADVKVGYLFEIWGFFFVQFNWWFFVFCYFQSDVLLFFNLMYCSFQPDILFISI